MESYASQLDTFNALKGLGFTKVKDPEGPSHRIFMDSPKNLPSGLSVVQVRLYVCLNGYWCVDVNQGDWCAPVIWNGPKADWDDTDPLDSFKKFLDEEYPGWQ